MPKSKREFKPTHYLDITSFMSLQIEVVVENCECFVYGAFYDSINRSFDHITKSKVRTNSYGKSYFIKSRNRYYLADFMSNYLF